MCYLKEKREGIVTIATSIGLSQYNSCIYMPKCLANIAIWTFVIRVR